MNEAIQRFEMALYDACDDSKCGEQKSHGPSFACSWLAMWPFRLANMERERERLLELVRVSIVTVFNHSEGLHYTLQFEL